MPQDPTEVAKWMLDVSKKWSWPKNILLKSTGINRRNLTTTPRPRRLSSQHLASRNAAGTARQEYQRGRVAAVRGILDDGEGCGAVRTHTAELAVQIGYAGAGEQIDSAMIERACIRYPSNLISCNQASSSGGVFTSAAGCGLIQVGSISLSAGHPAFRAPIAPAIDRQAAAARR